MKLVHLFFLLFMALMVVSGSSTAKDTPYQFDPIEIQRKGAVFTGGMNFLSEQCGLSSSGQLDESREKQRVRAIEVGLPGEEFDKLYANSRTQTSNIWKTATEKERRETCDQALYLMGTSS